MAADLDRLIDEVLRALADGAAATPDALSFLLRGYRATGRADVRDTLEPALTSALLERFDRRSSRDRAALLFVFVEAAAAAEDARVIAGVEALTASVLAEFGEATHVDAACAAVEACLAAGAVLDPRSVVPPAIDELERVVGAAYRPGEGLVHDLRIPGGSRGHVSDHVYAASALLAAYGITGRIPYAMLAEELMHFVWRTHWDAEAAMFTCDAAPQDEAFAVNCAAARVWCRLASLHGDDDYRAKAVTADRAVDVADAARMLSSPRMESAARGLACAPYGLAVADAWGL